MKKSHELLQSYCLNCDSDITGIFCDQCGQKNRNNSDRSLSQLLGVFFTNTFFIDNRFFRSAWSLIRYPGRMTVEFIKGRRKRYISPVALFLFINLLYFFNSSLSDYSLALYDQVHSQPYSGTWTQDWVDAKLLKDGLSEHQFSIRYQELSDNISKSIMIINVPLIAIFVFLLVLKKRRFYYDSLIFSFHYFSVLLSSWIMMNWVDTLITFIIGYDNSILADFTSTSFIIFVPILYAIISIKKFMSIGWVWAIPIGFGVFVSVLLSGLFYRLINFVLTMLII